MNGDLGNLLTGEMGEAESRFASDDFAEAYGRRVMGRVRRRRAVRAAGVGGGTMLTAGALVVGATHMPWGVLGAASGVGGSDCVTPSPSDDSYMYEVTVPVGDTPAGTVSLQDAATGATILTAVSQPDGSYVFTDAEGNPLKATPEASGDYRVMVSQAPTADAWGTAPPGGAEILVKSISTSAFADTRGTAPSPSDDCYTPSPTPSAGPSLTTDIYPAPAPSLAAKPENVVGDSPFQCGFTFPTDSNATDDLWIDGLTWTTADEINAQMKQKFAGHEQDIFAVASGTARIPIVNVSDRIGAVLGLYSYQVSRATVDPRVVQASLEPIKPGGPPLPFEGFTFVAVTDRTVVGTIDPAHPVEKLPTLGPNTDPHAISEQQTLLNSEDPFTACPGVTVGNDVDFYAIAGTIAFDSTGVVYEPTYVWLNIGRP